MTTDKIQGLLRSQTDMITEQPRLQTGTTIGKIQEQMHLQIGTIIGLIVEPIRNLTGIITGMTIEAQRNLADMIVGKITGLITTKAARVHNLVELQALAKVTRNQAGHRVQDLAVRNLVELLV